MTRHDSGPNKILYAAIFFLCAGLLVSRLFVRGGEPPAPAPNRSSAIASAPTPVPARRKPKSKKKLAVEKAGTNGQHDPELIEFKVEGNLAIAFGDVILGEVDDDTGAEGLYRPTAPQLWPDHEVPYAIAPDVPQPERIESAIRYYNDHTPVKFVPYSGEPDAIMFERGDKNCYSLLGKQGGIQPVKLADTCGTNEILHELMHALGFIHEHSRLDRDNYVQVVWDNVDDQYRRQFDLVAPVQMGPEAGTPFDYHSIMLYPPNLFGKTPGLVTLRSVTDEPIAPVQGRLSDGDLERLNQQYK